MIGAGIFAALSPAAGAAGTGLLVGLGVAAVVAYCNAVSSAQLAAVYPASGGTYVYGRERLGPVWGFVAGWGFVIGKTASCAAMALTFAAYVAPDWSRPVAAAAVLLLTLVNLAGVTRTAWLTRLILVVVLASLATVVSATVASHPGVGNLANPFEGGPRGILQAGGLLFFAFAGYARIATLGEEVRDPRRTIPRAIPLALFIALAVYAAVAIAALLAVGARTLASTPAPLSAVVEASPWSWAEPVVKVGAAVAALGVLLSLLAGVSRTTFAMADEHDLPHWLAAVHERRRVPHRAEIAIGCIVAVTVLVVDLRGAIGFSSFAVLAYYAIANVSAWTLPPQQRRWPRAFALAGLVGCVTLAFSLPVASVVGGTVLLAAGVVIWSIRERRRSRRIDTHRRGVGPADQQAAN